MEILSIYYEHYWFDVSAYLPLKKTSSAYINHIEY